MKQVARNKIHEVHYKGWTLKQVPWNAYGKKQYAKWLFDETGRERLHAGYSGYCSHKELRLMIRNDVEKVIPMLSRICEERKNNERTTIDN